MPVSRFTVPGHATRREFAVYIVVARKQRSSEFHLYVGKTGDNRVGCNPVISRAGNHFSYNDIHSQVRNKLPMAPDFYDFEYFYVTFESYDGSTIQRRTKVDVVNEMERATNQALRDKLSEKLRDCLLNGYEGNGYVTKAKRLARAALRTPERMAKVEALVRVVMEHVISVAPTVANQALNSEGKKRYAD